MVLAARPDAPATRRNREAILSVLREEFGGCSSVLEIGSGTGQHAVYFAAHLPSLEWQTSDLVENHDAIKAWLVDAPGNVHEPLALDVVHCDSVDGPYDAVFSANTAHIMHFHAVKCMFRLVGRTLSAGGVFCLYGPFNIDGQFSSQSNARFDQSLKERDPGMGIRDLAAIARLARDNGLELKRQYAMPANNMILSWVRAGSE